MTKTVMTAVTNVNLLVAQINNTENRTNQVLKRGRLVEKICKFTESMEYTPTLRLRGHVGNKWFMPQDRWSMLITLKDSGPT